MKKSFGILVVLLVLVAVGVLALPGNQVRGLLLGEAFFDGHPTSYWSGKLRHANPEKAEEARQQLVSGGDAAVPVLRVLLQQSANDAWKSAGVQAVTVEILAEIGPGANESAAELLSATQGDDPLVRAAAAVALPAVGCPAERAVPRLLEMIQEDPLPRLLRALSEYGPEAEPTLETLCGILQDQTLASDVRWNAARTLGKMHAAGAAAIPVVVAHLDDDADTVREHCAEALGDIGPAAQHTAPLLIGKLTDPAYRVRKDAARSLGQIDADPAVAIPELKKLLKDEHEIVREFANTAIQRLTPADPSHPDSDQPSP